jgi:hypothetical protein
MKMSLSRCAFAATAAAVLVLAPVRPDSGQLQRVQSHYRELCRLIAVWDPNRTEPSVVPAPQRPTAENWHGLVSGLSSVTVSVNYGAGFTPEARAAFQAAVDVWASTLSSAVPVTVDANFSPLGTGVLGQAGSTFVYMGGPAPSGFGAGQASTFYHAALANKLAGVDVDPTASDITATFNSAFSSWYFGTDGKPGIGQYDFMSVVLHELGHGLGFSGSATSNGSTGSYGLGSGSAPMIYDRFAETASRQALLNTAIFPNPSAALHSALTSEVAGDAASGLFWNGAAGVAAAGGGTNRPRLDALSPFTAGSNFSHLSDATYPAGNANSLMTRALTNQEVIHNPGPLTLGMFQDEGWTFGCTYSIAPTSAVVPLTASTGNTVTVTAPAGCAWSATTPAGSFVTITAGATGIGNGTVTYSVTATSAARSTTLTIAGLPFVVNQTTAPVITLDHPSLKFGGTLSGSTLTNNTAAQTVGVTITNVTGAAWTAAVASTSPWLRVTGGAGTGNGAFSVSVVSDASLAGQTSVAGTINVTATGATTATVSVTLTLKAPTNTATGITGFLDTPADGSVNSGSVAVTGWALDDIEIVRVQILRDAHPNDPPAAVSGGRVFVGDASFVEGARPDLETAQPGTPLNYRAGFGYLLLTRGLIWDGGGSFRLYAIATDKEGNTATLGSKLITVNNAASAKPFGSIDTPGQGATVSGLYPNTGWVLTPGSVAPGTATIPASGVRVAIDGVFLAGVPSVSARSDISAGFPQFNTSQAGRGLFIDTTLYANGSHTIGWLVTDSVGQADGVGSRFFKIQNTALVTTTASRGLAGSSTTFGDVFQAAARLTGIDTGAAVHVATGFDPRARLRAVRPDAFGRRHVAIPEMDRVEVRLSSLPKKSGSYAAYQVANGQLRRLPVGSSFDPRNGTLYWQPGAGYVGDYEFVVVDQTRRDAKRLTRVVVSVGKTASPVLAARTRATN